MIIDAHSHWLAKKIIDNAHFFSCAWGDADSHARMMDEMCIEKSVISYPTSDAHIKLGGQAELAALYNDNVLRLMKSYPGKFIGAAVLPVTKGYNMAEEVRSAADKGFSAISLATSYEGIYLDDPMFDQVYKACRERKLPVFVHSQIIKPIGCERVEDPLLTPVIEYVFDTTICIGKMLMSGILKEYQDLKFIFAYFGGVSCHLWHRYDATYQMLRGINFVKDLKGDPSGHLKNIYVDTSGDIHLPNFLSALELLGPEHILWGSDWPAKKDIRAGMKAVNSLDITEEAKQGILGNNLKKLLNI